MRALHRGPRALVLLVDGWGFDDLLVQYHPHYYVRGGWWSRLLSYLSWAALVRLRRVSFVVHELDDPRPAELGRRGRVEFLVEEAVRRSFWKRARRVVFLSAWQRDQFLDRFPYGRRRTLALAAHGELFAPAARASKAEARSRLGLDPDRVLVLMIGFISPRQPDKGYAQALTAVQEAGDPAIDLYIVGSPIREHPEVDELLQTLRRAASTSSQVHLDERWLSDPEFDLWVLAADAVLLPYRESASSGVAARARMLGTRIISSGVGGLAEQLGPGDLIAETNRDLVAALRDVAAARSGPDA
jgi:glycosyltransferase involved in cell wall biosynthesis